MATLAQVRRFGVQETSGGVQWRVAAQQAVPADKFALRANLRLNCGVSAHNNMERPDPTQDQVYGRINKLMHLTRKEDERGLVLSVAAFAEDLLGRLLSAYLREGKATTDLLEGFNAPLGTFSSRIKACFACGLISDEQYKDLEIARKIRNEFAHNWEGCSFSKQNVSDLAATMSDSRITKEKPATPKERFDASMQCTLVELTYMASTLGKGGRVAPVIATHLGLEPYRGAR